MGEEWAVETGDGGKGRKSGHTSQSSPAGGLKVMQWCPTAELVTLAVMGTAKREHSVLRKQDGAVAWW